MKLDAGDKLILQQLARIEGLLHPSLGMVGMSLSSTSPATSNDPNTGTEDPATGTINTAPMSAKLSAAGLRSWFNPPQSISISTMPKTHTTPAPPAMASQSWPSYRPLDGGAIRTRRALILLGRELCEDC